LNVFIKPEFFISAWIHYPPDIYHSIKNIPKMDFKNIHAAFYSYPLKQIIDKGLPHLFILHR